VNQHPIRVCFLSTYAYGLFVPGTTEAVGGAEVQFRHLSAALARDQAFDPWVVTGDFGQAKVEEHEGVTLCRGPTPRPSDGILRKLGHAVRYYRLLREIDADVYITTATTTNILLVSLFCRHHGKRHIHRTAHEREVSSLQTDKGLMPLLYRAGFRMTDLVVTQNESQMDLLKRNCGIESMVLRNSFPVADRYIPFAERKHVLWMARCVPWKRPELFIDLAERFPAEEFIMIAPAGTEGDDAYQQEISAKASRLANVTFIDHVPFAETQGYLDHARFFVNTSEREGFPNTFLQAGLGRTPVLSLGVDPDGFIAKHGCGYACNDSFDDMVEKARLLLSDASQCVLRGTANFEYVKANHDIAENIETLKNILGELVQGRR